MHSAVTLGKIRADAVSLIVTSIHFIWPPKAHRPVSIRGMELFYRFILFAIVLFC